MRGLLGLSVLLSLVSGSVVLANEIDGFRLGMPMAKARELAAEKKYTFGNPVKGDPNDRSVDYCLVKGGPCLGFCDSTLSSVTMTRPSSINEVAGTIKEWKSIYGEPQVAPNIWYLQGKQYSSVQFNWFGDDNIQRDIAISQYEQGETQIAFGYSYIKHPCRH